MSDLLVTGGQVLRPDMTVERADVLVDQDAGTIEAVGDPGGGDDELDAAGGLVIPGLVNTHTHVAMTLLRGLADDKPLDAWLREDIWPVEAELTPEDIRVGAELGLIEMIKSGTTALSDMYFAVEEIAQAVEQAGVRARLGYTAVTVGKDDEGARADLERSLEVAQEFDGAADGRIRTTFQPHSLTTVGEQFLREFVPQANEAGLATHLHANETPDEVGPIVEEHGVRPLAYAEDLGLLAGETYVAHGVHVDDSEIELLVETDTGVAHCPASNMKLASGMAPVQDMLDAGVTVGIGTDGAASNNDLDMFDEMRDAAMLGKLAAEDASAVDAPTVVEMATANGADLLGFDSGRIEPGANADLAVLNLDVPHLTPAHDLVSHLAYAARGSDVRHTVADGQVLMRDREVTVFDEDRVREAAVDHADALVERAM
ncbi:5-methylthioadenosine-S-adenosylhomocysteine deaminase protein [Halorhabdus tiamatea SARL4B]|uniref:5-methylthioadenosine/S-adenosylhomocysteine deaminase n=1 Tax=Halorhabdus tiamatea SARL4B TaxID=1033806 RepID=F7PP03_9EURY|nr:amidohydrolase [Halorhabdus tiamatea]ERJ06730.1 5-methylthioadenosine-S-adenosylhomocysteine deaminase protein [Halorhabdus tiamatea SARL4B]CCQ33652.1 amidohydrolase [Halorhabdus tiamatea SARL4B]